MKDLTLVAAGVLFASVSVLGQTTTQPVQQTTTPVTNSQSVQSTQSGQNVRTMPVQSGQIPKAYSNQDPHMIQAQPVIPGAVIADPNAPAGTQATDPNAANQQTDPNAVQPVLTNEQIQQAIDNQILNTTQPAQPVNSGQVPKAYTNLQETMPFRQYQPKPTGQISPQGTAPRSAPGRVR